MATLDFSNATQYFNMADPKLTEVRRVDNATGTQWTYLTPDGHYVSVTGRGLIYDTDGRPIDGVVESITIDLGSNSGGFPDIVIDGLDAPAVDLAGADFWKLLDGDDVISGPSAAKIGEEGPRIFGDGIAAPAGAATGGDDNIQFGDARVTVIGDVDTVGSFAAGGPTADYHGGNDLIQGAFTGASQYVYGDAVYVRATGRLTGGDDRIVMQSGGSSLAAGDAFAVEGVEGDTAELFGGDDTMVVGSGQAQVTWFGDTLAQGSHSFVRGGNDTISDGDLGDFIIGDVGRAGSSNSETVGGNDTIYGNGGDDAIAGEVFNWSDGKLAGGNDTIYGGFGADAIFGETVNGGLVGVSGGNDRLYGDAGDDRIYGQTGNDILDGGNGADTLDGGQGSDAASYATAAAGVTADLRSASVNTGDAMGDTYKDIEKLIGSAFGDSLRGNDGSNVIQGNDGNDVLIGRGGADTLIGGAGSDTLNGEDGDDTIDGGLGKDNLAGGIGGDRFDFNALTDSAVGSGRDVIRDFTVNPAGGAGFIDRLDVSTIDAKAGTSGDQAFSFVGTGAFTAEGQIRVVQSGAHTIVQFNTAGTGGAEMELTLADFLAGTLGAVDFIL